MADVIFDVDGTLADCSHRLHFIQNKPKNWTAFFAGIPYDQPIRETMHVLHCLAVADDGAGYPWNRIIFCTGRPNSTRPQTVDWLKKYLGGWCMGAPLYMRSDNDYRPDYVVKEEMLGAMHKDGYDPKIAFEDRDQVVDMWRRNGLICYQVAKGGY